MVELEKTLLGLCFALFEFTGKRALRWFIFGVFFRIWDFGMNYHIFKVRWLFKDGDGWFFENVLCVRVGLEYLKAFF